MENKNLLKKVGIYFLGNLSSKILSTLIVPIYAFYVSTKDLGSFDFFQTIMSIISPIILCGIWEAVLKFILTTDSKEDKKIITDTTFIFMVVQSLIYFLCAYLFYNIISFNIEYYFLIILMIYFSSIVSLWQYYARALKQNKLFVISGVLSTVVNFISVLFFVVFLKKGLLGLLLSYILGQLITIFIIEYKLKIIKNIKYNNFNIYLLKKMIIFSIPLTLNLLSGWLLSGFGRMLITLKLGSLENGLYTFANKFSLIVVLLGNVITMAIVEEAIISSKEGKLSESFGKNIENLFIIFFNGMFLALPLIKLFYTFISDTEYVNSIYYVPLLLLYAVILNMASNIGTAFQVIEKTKHLFVTTVIGGLVTVVISLIFIGEYKIYAVIVAQLLGAFVMYLSRLYYIRKYSTVFFNEKKIIFYLIIYLLLSVSIVKFGYIYGVFIEIIILTMFFVLNKSKIIFFFKRK